QNHQRGHRPEVGDECGRHDSLADERLVEPGLDEHRVDHRQARRRERDARDLGLTVIPAEPVIGERPTTTNGAPKETSPIDNDAFHSRRNCGTSTSAPARKVSPTPAKEPRNANQPGTVSEKAFPTTNPAASSISATENPISTETIDATR